nr:hypothetical protein [uncultured Dyadobacter sp.]
MKLALLSLLTLLSVNVFSQTEISITVVKTSNGKNLKIEKKSKDYVKPNAYYKITVDGVNPAHTTLKVTTVSKEIYTPLPEVLKTLPLNLAGSIVRSNDGKKAQDELKVLVDAKLKKLNVLKICADSLHDISLFLPNPMEALRFYKMARSEYSLKKDSLEADLAFKTAVLEDIQFIKSLKSVGDAINETYPSYDADDIYLLSKISTVSTEFEKVDYKSLLEYLIRSVKITKKSLTSNEFKASKDLSEVKIVLVDNYTKDTLLNEQETIFTSGGSSFGISFSTGFIYTGDFSDQPYYLKSRVDEKVAVINDEKVKHDISFGGIAHAYYKPTPWLRFGIGLGLSISPFDGKTRYLAGPTLMLGKEKSVSITFGKAWAKIKELSQLVESDSLGLFLPKGTTTVPTFDKWKSGLFIALTYNLAAIRK